MMSLFVFQNLIWSQTFYDLPKPNLKREGVPHTRLEVVKNIKSDFDDDLFFAVPVLIIAGKDNYFYVFDQKLCQIFVFDGNYRCINQCLSIGQGPGQTPSALNKALYVDREGLLYCHDGIGDKILVYSQQGKYIKETRLYHHAYTLREFYPIYDSKGSLYTFSLKNGIVDKFDKNLKLVTTYLDNSLNRLSIFCRPDWEGWDAQHSKYAPRLAWEKPSMGNVFYDITADEKLFIFLHRSATAYIFEKDKLVRKFAIHIDGILQQYPKMVLEDIEAFKKRNSGRAYTNEMYVFFSCFLDKDAPFFYLQVNGDEGACALYQFDFNGKFTRIFDIYQQPAVFNSKRNGLYYGLSTNHYTPIIFKPTSKTK